MNINNHDRAIIVTNALSLLAQDTLRYTVVIMAMEKLNESIREGMKTLGKSLLIKLQSEVFKTIRLGGA